MKRTPLTRRSPLRRSGRLAPMSAKRSVDLIAYRAARALTELRAQGRCECGGFCPDCPGTGSEAHHVRRRSQGGDHDTDNLRWLAAVCHRYVHENPDAARAAGLLAPKGSAHAA